MAVRRRCGGVYVLYLVAFLPALAPATPYFVNDSTTNGDVYTTAPGSAGNDGLLPASPKAGLQDVLDTYDLDPGDIVYVDTGYYPPVTSSIVMDASDSGSTNVPVTVQGSTNLLGGGTVLTLFGAGSVLSLDGTTGVVIRFLTLDGYGSSPYGVSFSQASQCRAEWVAARRCSAAGFRVDQSPNCSFEHCTAAGNYRGMWHLSGSSNTVWRNGVMWSNYYGACVDNASAGKLTVEDSVIGAVARSNSGYYVVSGTLVSDYNSVYAIGTAFVGEQSLIRYSTLPLWQMATGRDTNSVGSDPLLADSTNSDFHPRSFAGRYVPGVGWRTSDTVMSPLVDSARPTAAWSNEPPPNGGRCNIGLYGNTPEASHSATSAWLQITELAYGRPMTTIKWAHYSTNAHTVRIEAYPKDLRQWVSVTSGVPASVGIAVLMQRRCDRWISFRVTDEQDESATDTEGIFYFGDPLMFFVNDSSTNGDMWCTAPGSPVNDGYFLDSPMDSIQRVLDCGDDLGLAAGVVIYVDTGDYYPTNTTVVNGDKITCPNTYLHIIGVPGKTTLHGYGIQFDGVPGHMENVAIEDAETAVHFLSADGSSARSVRLIDSCTGLRITDSGGCLLEHSLVAGNSSNGMLVEAASVGNVCSNSVLWSNRCGIAVKSGGSIAVRNSILGSFATNGLAYELTGGSISSDYNTIYVQAGAAASQTGAIRTTLADWQLASGQDLNSFDLDPLFANATGGDFHLKSKVGRYLSGSWVIDTTNSPCIDTGDPLSRYYLEPVPNGNCVNQGMYGQTTEASKSEDTDGDGASDTLEQYRLGTSITNADSDGDFSSDGVEWIAGTDANDSNSFFCVVGYEAAPDAANHMVIHWDSRPERTYTILLSTNIANGFGIVLADGLVYPQNSYTDMVDRTGSVYLYGIRTQR